MTQPVQLADVFRDEWPRLVATLVRDFGDLELAEDAAQDAFVAASITWKPDTRPASPGAWLLTTARRKCIDRMRRSNRFDNKLAALAAHEQSASDGRRANGLVDDQLALLLGCCHPSLSRDAQVALTLRAVAGLSTAQIAGAFLVPEAAMAKRLTRARAKIRGAGIPFSVPDRTLLRDRLDQVVQVVYLVFTEGHASATDAALVRGDLCDEALWLSALVAELVPDDCESQSLAALIRLTDGRRHARVGPDGQAVLMSDQNRMLWDREKIGTGLAYLDQARRCGNPGPLFFQAAVSALHSTAPSFEKTDWAAIVELYDRQLRLDPSPVLLLNRAAALSYAVGTDVGLAEMDQLAEDLDGYVYFHSARAQLLRRSGDKNAARAAYERALGCEPGEGQRTFLERSLRELD